MLSNASCRRLLTLAVSSTIVACSEGVPTESVNLDVRAAKGATTGPTVTSTSPSSSLRGVTLDVRVFGSGFDQGTKAQWAIKGVPANKVVTNSTTFVSSKELVANITIASDAEVTLYDVIVTTATGKPGIGTEKFEVTVQITDLGTLGGTEAGAVAINENGQITGYSTTSSGSARAFLWENGVMRELGVPAGFTSSRGEGINNLGHVVGYAMVQINGEWNSRAFLWTPENGMQLLTGATKSVARAINDDGLIVGSAFRSDGTWSGAVWINGAITFLADGTSEVWDVNNLGQAIVPCLPKVVVGNMTWNSTCVWSSTAGLQYVAALRGSIGEPIGINDNGDVVGWGPHATLDDTHGFVSRSTGVQDLSINSVGIKIAPNGMIAGRGADNRAVMWYPTGAMVTLPGYLGSTSTTASDVNSKKEVVGWVTSTRKGRTSGFARYAIKWTIN